MDICAKGFIAGYNILLVPKLLLTMFLQRPKKPKKPKKKAKEKKGNTKSEISTKEKENS